MKITRTVHIRPHIEKVGRNDPCSCGSGKKYKKCHLLLVEPQEFFEPSLTKGFITKLLDFSTGEVWYEKAFKNTKHDQHKSYEMLKKELFAIILKEEMPFDLADFDKNLKKAKNPNIFFYPLYKTCYEQPDLAQKVMRLTVDLWQSVNQNTDYSGDKVAMGPMESVLLNEFMKDCGRRFEKEQIIDPEKQIKLSNIWQKEWLTHPKKALNFKTPGEAILAERKERGEKSISFNFNTVAFFAPKNWDKADKLHLKGIKASRNYDYQKARQYYSEIVDHYPDYPFIYRSIANLGMSYIALGDKKKGLDFLQKAKDMNPNYRFARKQYELVNKLPLEKIEKQADALHMQKAMERLLGMVKKVQARKLKRSPEIKKKKNND